MSAAFSLSEALVGGINGRWKRRATIRHIAKGESVFSVKYRLIDVGPELF
jgi:hypothetical protein